MLLSSLTKACRIINDRVTVRLPIYKGLLEVILFELECIFKDQSYLELLVKTIFIIGYYGLLRIGEMANEKHIKGKAQPSHAIQALNVYIGENKRKILLVLYTSKTHGKESLPQKIKITESSEGKRQDIKHFCPFNMLSTYIKYRDNPCSVDEQLFIFRGGEPVRPEHIRGVLRTCLENIGLNPRVYPVHCLRAGRASDLIKLGFTVEQVQRLGRWKSNAVYKYIK